LTGVRWLTVFLDFPAGSFDAGVAFWREVTGPGLSPFRGTATEFATLLPAAGDAYLRVQRTADGSAGHHLDPHVDPAVASVEQAAARAEALGARLAGRHAAAGARILAVLPRETTMTDPTGRPYCLTIRDPGAS
jgi:hypothetical protein